MTQHYQVPVHNYKGFLAVFGYYGIPNAVLTPAAPENGVIKIKITVPNKIHRSQLKDLQTSLDLPTEEKIWN